MTDPTDLRSDAVRREIPVTVVRLRAEINALHERVAELEGVLGPFAYIDGEGDEDYPDETKATLTFGRTTFYSLTLGDLRRATRAALGGSQMPDTHCAHSRSYNERCIECELVWANEGVEWAKKDIAKYRERIQRLKAEKGSQ
jgi:hypothetical protein